MDHKLEPGLGELLRHLTDLVDHGAEQVHHHMGRAYRPRYTPIMRALASGARNIGEITACLAITQGAVSQTIKLMRDDGLVTRRAGSDARQSHIALTRAGKNLLAGLNRHWTAVFRAVAELEQEIGLPLRTVLAHSIAALEETDFATRITAAQARDPGEPPVTRRDETTSPRDHFQSGGENYARYRPAYSAELARALAELAPARGLAIDVGCGSGQLSVLLAEHFARVIASDVSADQLLHATSHPGVDYRCETAEAMSAADSSADLIVAAQAAHWLDLPRFYKEVQRVARPGAVLALVSYGVPYLQGRVNLRLQQFYWRSLADYWPAERRHVETGYAGFLFPFEELDPPELTIHEDWDLQQLLGYIQTWSATRRAIAAGRGELVRDFAGELAAIWGEPEAKRRIGWPVAMRLGRIK